MLLVFANDRTDGDYLRDLVEERKRLESILQPLADQALIELVVLPNTSLDELNAALLRHAGRIAIFHFGGHASEAELVFEEQDGSPVAVNATQLAPLLGQQPGLKFVFLNGCLTQAHSDDLLNQGIPAVIGTVEAVRDELACSFACDFYAALANNLTLDAAFTHAVHASRLACADPADAYGTAADAAPLGSDPWPWSLRIRRGAEDIAAWNLTLATGDFLFGLPALPEDAPLPNSPFHSALSWYTEEQAELFFGRNRQIRQLFFLLAPEQANETVQADAVLAHAGSPVVLLYGQSGVGKSSFLEAGLFPRLKQRCTVLPVRRDRTLGLNGTLSAAFGLPSDAGAAAVLAAWHSRETADNRTLVVLFDQVEEVLTRPLDDQPDELQQFAATVAALFNVASTRPLGRLVLSFRKEHFTDIDQVLRNEGIDRTLFALERLDQSAIVEVVTGPTVTPRLRNKYQLTVEPDLPATIARDLTRDPASPIATVLHILLTDMWQSSSRDAPHAPRFDRALYGRFYDRGLSLRQFFDQRIHELSETQPDAVASGLVFDLLHFHTTTQGTAEQRSKLDIAATYAGNQTDRAQQIDVIVQACKDYRLLSDPTGELHDAEGSRGARLAHDTLAPIVIDAFTGSNHPGQRARRILESRIRPSVPTPAGQAVAPASAPLEQNDLALVETGLAGMRNLTPGEQELLRLSRRRRTQDQRRRRLYQFLGIAAVAAILVLALLSLASANEANRQRLAAVDNANRLAEEQAAALAAKQTADLNARTASLQEQAAKEAQARAEVNLQEAQRQRTAAEVNARRSKASELVTYVQAQIGERRYDPSLALLLAEAAVSSTWTPDGYVTANADASLQQAIDAVQSIGWLYTLPSHHHTGPVNSAAFSPDGKHILTASADQSVRVWNATTGAQQQLFTGHSGPAITAAYAPGRPWIVSGGDDGVLRLWTTDTPTGARTIYTTTSWIRAVAVHPSQDEIALGLESGAIMLLKGLTETTVITLAGHIGRVDAVTFIAQGSRLASGGADGMVRLWDSADGKILGVLPGHAGEVKWVGETPSGMLLSADREGNLKLWDLIAWRERRAASGEDSDLRAAAIDQSGVRLATAHEDGTVFLWGLPSFTQTAVLHGSGSPLLAVAFSPDGKTLITGGEDGSVRTWDVAGGREIYLMAGHTGDVRSAAFNSDDSLLVTTGADGTVRLWSVADGQQLDVVRGDNGPDQLMRFATFSPEGTQIAIAADDGSVAIWDLRTDTLLPCVPVTGQAMRSAVFSPDGTLLLVAGDDATPRLLDAANCAEVGRLTGHTGKVRSAQFSPDGSMIVTASEDHTARLWDANLWDAKTYSAREPALQHNDWVMYAAFSPDGTSVVTASNDRYARIWTVATGDKVRELGAHAGVVRTAMYSPDGTMILTADEDGTSWLWDAATGRRLRPLLKHEAGVRFATFDHAGKQIATAGEDGTVRLFRLDPTPDARLLAGHSNLVRGAAFSPDGHTVATAGLDGVVILWDATTGERLQTLDAGQKTIWTVTFSPDSKFVFGGSEDGFIWVWNTEDPKPVRRIQVSHDAVLVIVFSPDGRTFATGGKDRIARIWDALTFSTIRTFAEGTGTIWSAAYSPDGKQLALGGEYGGLTVVGVEVGAAMRSFADPSAWIWGVAYSHDGTKIAAAGKDGRVRVLDAYTGEMLLELAGHAGLVRAVLFTTDDSQLISAGEDRRIRFWDLATGQQVRELVGHTDVIWSLALSPDGSELVSASLDHTARLWDVSIEQTRLRGMDLVQRDPPLLTVDEQVQYGLPPNPGP